MRWLRPLNCMNIQSDMRTPASHWTCMEYLITCAIRISHSTGYSRDETRKARLLSFAFVLRPIIIQFVASTVRRYCCIFIFHHQFYCFKADNFQPIIYLQHCMLHLDLHWVASWAARTQRFQWIHAICIYWCGGEKNRQFR